MDKILQFNLEKESASSMNINIAHFYNLIHPDLIEKQKYQDKDAEWSKEYKSKVDQSIQNKPINYIEMFKKNLEGFPPIDWDCLDFCDDPIAREKAWLSKNLRGHPGNCINTNGIIKYYQKEAEKLGEKSWAHYQAKSLGGLEKVKRELSEFKKEIEPKYNTLLTKLKAINNDKEIKPWDISYLLNKYKKSKLNTQNNSLEKTTINDALNKITSVWSKMGLTTKVEEMIELVGVKLLPLDVYQSDHFIGTILLDPYKHKGKHTRGLSTVVIPRNEYTEAVSYCNFSIEDSDNLTKREFVTMITETAHGLHFILSKVPINTHLGLEVPVNHMLHHLELDNNELAVVQQMEDIRVSEWCINIFEYGSIYDEEKKIKFPSEERWECNLTQICSMNSTYYHYLYGDMISSKYYEPEKLLNGMESNKFI